MVNLRLRVNIHYTNNMSSRVGLHNVSESEREDSENALSALVIVIVIMVFIIYR